MDEKSRILGGLRVLDFTTMVSGPFATRLLADCGADVVKVESPQGDLLRHTPPLVDGQSRYFAAFNCGKRSLVLDLKEADDVAVARRRAGAADVVVENARPGVMDRLGLGADDLRRENPRLVYCSISGFGQHGPSSDRPAYATIVQALSGFDDVFSAYQPNAESPPTCGIQIADVLAASFAFGAIQTALLKAERTGVGERIDLSLVESILTMITGDLQAAQAPQPTRLPSYPPIRAKDGFLTIPIISPRGFEALSDVVDPSWKSDPRFDGFAARAAHMHELLSAVEAWTSERSADECEQILLGRGVPCARFRSALEVLDDPQLQSREIFTTLSDGDGEYLVNGPPFRFESSPTSLRGEAPGLGEAREAVERAWLGGATS